MDAMGDMLREMLEQAQAARVARIVAETDEILAATAALRTRPRLFAITERLDGKPLTALRAWN